MAQTAYLRPIAITQFDSAWKSPLVEKVGEDWGAFNGETIKHSPTSATNDTIRFRIQTLLSEPTSITSVRVAIFASTVDGGRAKGHYRFMGGGGTTFNDASYTNLPSSLGIIELDEHTTVPAGPNVGLPWTFADLDPDALEAGVLFQDPSAPFKNSILDTWALKVVFEGAPIPLDQVTHIGSRAQYDLRRPKSMISLTVPTYEAFEAELFDAVGIAHPSGPHPEDAGWLDTEDKRHRGIIYGRIPKPGTGLVDLDIRSGRTDIVRFRDDMQATRSADVLGDTISRIGPLVTRLFTRDSNAWVEDPGSRLMVEVGPDQERHGYGGDYFENESKNKLMHSGFQSGGAGAADFDDWVKVGDGVNDSLIESDTTNLQFWDKRTTGVAQSCRFLAGAIIPSGDLYVEQVTETFLASGIARIQCSYINDTPDTVIGVQIRRSTDNGVWREASQSFLSSGANTWNLLEPSEGLVPKRWRSLQIQGPGTPFSLTVRIGIPEAEAVPEQEAHVYWAQAEEGRSATSPILTANSYVTREADLLQISNDKNTRLMIETQGTIAIECIAWWNVDDRPGETPTVWSVFYDTDNRARLFYDIDNREWNFVRRVAGVDYLNTLLQPIFENALNRIIIRMTGPAHELGRPAFSQNMLVNNLGAGVTQAPHAPIMSDEANVEIGSAIQTNRWGGQIRKFRVYPYVMTDAEAQQYPED